MLLATYRHVRRDFKRGVLVGNPRCGGVGAQPLDADKIARG